MAQDYSVIASANDGRELLNSAMNESISDYNVTGAKLDYEKAMAGLQGHSNSEAGDNWRHMRLQSDLALINCVKEDTTHTNNFTRPPFHPITLFFEDSRVEKEYRKIAWRGLKNYKKNAEHTENSSDAAPSHQHVKTLSPALFDAYFDVVVVGLVFGIVCMDCFWSYTTISTPFLVYFILASLFLVSGILVMVKHVDGHHAAAAPETNHALYPMSRHHKPFVARVRSSGPAIRHSGVAAL